MAIYRLFPIKDATLTSEVPYANTGKDEIVEIAAYQDSTGTHRINRGVVQFSTEEIQTVINTVAGNAPFRATLNYYIAEASELPTDFNIQAAPLFQEWNEGRGELGDTPEDTSGISWFYTKANKSTPWIGSSFPPGVTGSFIQGEGGGGTWYYDFSGSSLISQQNFSYKQDTNISIDITDIIKLHLSGSIPNYGFILKLEKDLSLTEQLSTRLKYFSSDTNTIYPPFLQIEWNDSTYQTGSLPSIENANLLVNFSENKSYYEQGEVLKIRLHPRPTYPVRTFTTGSIYTQVYTLPENSQWALKDEYTGEKIVEFSEYTKISCDNISPYFLLYMNTLQPERYYRLLIKTTIDGSTTVLDNKNIFKVVKK